MIVGQFKVGDGVTTVELQENGTSISGVRVTNTASAAVIVTVWAEGTAFISRTIAAGGEYSRNIPGNPALQSYLDTVQLGWTARLA